ncbi:hypothetical protein QQ045_013366 [Rhodiola kirilowii]
MLNPEKSKIFFSGNINEKRRKSVLELTQFTKDTFPVKYLGAPLFPMEAKASYFNHLEDTVKGKVASWAKNFLSMSGRATLISAVLASVKALILDITGSIGIAFASLKMREVLVLGSSPR